MQMFTTFPWVHDSLGYCKQLPLNFTLALGPYWNSNTGVRLLSDVVDGLIVSADNFLDFHDET